MTPSPRVVSSAVSRKLDPSLPGVEETLAEFAGLDLPRFQVGFPPQHLLLTLVGDYLAGSGEPIPSAALVALLGEFGVNPAGARAALGRLTSRGVLVGSKVGRNTYYRQAEALTSFLPHAQAMTLRFGATTSTWDGRWTFVAFSLPEVARKQRPVLRSRLRALGFAPLFDGLWVSPFPPQEDLSTALDAFPEARCSVVVGRAEEGSGRVGPLSAWSMEETRTLYDEFIGSTEAARPGIAEGGITPTRALVTRITAVYSWFVIANTDPDLPDELLPAGWPRATARALFVEVVDSLAPLAEQRVREVFAEFSPDLAALVTATPSAGSFDR